MGDDNTFRLCSIPRLPGALHSRLHRLSWSKALHPEPVAELHPADGRKLSIADGESIELFTEQATITLKAKFTNKAQRGSIYVYHSYPQADVNSLLKVEHVDPYSGFPAFRSALVQVRKKVI